MRDKYPRYETIREAFANDVRRFEQFIEDEQLGTLTFRQCEVTYVNHVPLSHSKAFELWGKWDAAQGATFLPRPEDATVTVRFPIRDAERRFRGRLAVVLQPAFHGPDRKEVYVMTLTARGRPQQPSISGAFDFLNEGREWVVKGFADLTNPQMHEAWGRTR